MKIVSFYPVDRITALPQPILDTILCLVPIKDAVKTSILSRSWRYNWTTIFKLVFDEKEMFNCQMMWTSTPRMSKMFVVIHRVLLKYQGPILEFSLTMNAFTGKIRTKNIRQIITYLSKNNTIKKLVLDLDCYPRSYSLPLSFYSLSQLTDIYLRNCDFYPTPTFDQRFPFLQTLHVDTGCPNGKSLGHLLSISPVLKSFTLMMNAGVSFKSDDSISMFEICKDLSLIEHMSLCLSPFEVYFKEAPSELPSALVHLKYLCLDGMQCIVRSLRALVFLIRSSPNLEKIKLQMCEGEVEKLATQRDIIDYSHISLEHLQELEIIDYGVDKYQLEFVQSVLAKSPVLRKVSIVFHKNVPVDDLKGIEAMRNFLISKPASRVAKFNFEHPKRDLDVFKFRYSIPIYKNMFGKNS